MNKKKFILTILTIFLITMTLWFIIDRLFFYEAPRVYQYEQGNEYSVLNQTYYLLSEADKHMAISKWTVVIMLSFTFAFLSAGLVDYFTDWSSPSYWMKGKLIKKEKSYFRSISPRASGSSGYMYYFTFLNEESEEVVLVGKSKEYVFLLEWAYINVRVRNKRILELEAITSF